MWIFKGALIGQLQEKVKGQDVWMPQKFLLEPEMSFFSSNLLLKGPINIIEETHLDKSGISKFLLSYKSARVVSRPLD